MGITHLSSCRNLNIVHVLVLGTVQTSIDAAKNFLNRKQDRLDGRTGFPTAKRDTKPFFCRNLFTNILSILILKMSIDSIVNQLKYLNSCACKAILMSFMKMDKCESF
ncbi:hypothetical protein BpHYR1_015900 [Brachionus plicatilis]|uniref:Uncharacterized protein n=1 Tax=Brachionus plicatilis TaxID=10195 RepID=A0A3M7RTJ5_BRAPC|nr:hypothetical protein BpHYR1_015900 [Brachionus plicatilis]